MKAADSHTSLGECLKTYFGFTTFVGSQEAIIRSVLSGHDTFVLMPTGAGKSLCYQLPALMMEGTAIVISPLIALMKNQVDNMRGFVEESGVAHFLNSTLSKAAILQVKEDVLRGTTKMLYVAPETLTKEENVEFLSRVKISFYAIDEAHCISEWGHDFRPEYRRIRAMVNKLGSAPIMALTATATPKVQHDIQKNLGMPDAVVFKSSFNRPNLYYEVRPKRDAVKDIIKYIRRHQGKSGIVYCLSRKGTEELAQALCINGIKALPYHAGMDAALRSANQDKFLMEEVDVIVATIAFGMGIDKPDVRFVIHYDIPKSLESYYQETGRAGRDHGEGQCIAFFSNKDAQKLGRFMSSKPTMVEQEIGRQLLQETVAYAESTVCRRKLLLHYFGEEYSTENCGSCDNCLNPQVKFDGMEYVVLLLQAVVEVNERCKARDLTNILRGELASVVKLFHYNELSIFGAGADRDTRFWDAVIRQSLINGMLKQDIEENYGVLQLTDKGRAFMENPYTIMLSESRVLSEDGGEEDSMGQPSKQTYGLDEELYSMLKGLLAETSKRLSKPPFVIFPDPSLQDMATQYPTTLEELQSCQGIGAGKAQKFGRPFVELIQKYVEEKGVERPQDMVVKSVVNKSANKVFIIQGIDRKMDLHDIANARKLTFNELLCEIETIVSSGTKLNVDYYINQTIDDDRCTDIWDYFAEQAVSGSVEEAMAILGSEDYTEEDVRLVRIRFLSEQGN